MKDHFRDRRQAGQALARLLARFHRAANTIVMALPRGGVPVAAEIAQALQLPLDICLVRKLGVPWQPELAMGAVATGGVKVLNGELIGDLAIPQADIDREVALERIELDRREKAYRGDQPRPDLRDKTVILVDDGIATGATAAAAIEASRLLGAKHVVIAVGVAAKSSLARLLGTADEVVCVLEPQHLSSIGEWFEDFSQVTDAEVRRLLSRSGSKPRMMAAGHGTGGE